MKTSNTVNPVRNSSEALNPAGIFIKNPAAEQWGIISNGVNVFGVRLANMHLV